MNSRRRFLGYFSSVGLASTTLPDVLWAGLQEQPAQRVTPDMLKHALAVVGLDFTDEERQQMLNGVNQALTRYEELRQIHIDPNLAPPLYYSPLVPGTRLDRVARGFKPSRARAVRRPADLEEAAFWPIADLAQLLRTRQVKSVELTEMYLGRLKRYNPALNFVVTYNEAQTLALARAYEQVAGWHKRHPTLT